MPYASFVFCLFWVAALLKSASAQGLTVRELSLFDLPPGFEDLGTFSLQLDAPGFGGLSALLLDPAGRLLSLSDQGYWVDLQGAELGNGRLSPPSHARIEAIDVLSDHRPSFHRQDAESLAWLDRGGDPRLYVGFERDHRVQRHLADGRADSRLPKPIALQGTFGNTGLEALSALPGTCLFAVTEGVQREGGLRAYRYCGGETGESWQTRVYRPSAPGFAPTAADLGPEGAYVYLVERALSGLQGFSARLTRVPVSAIEAGEVLIPELVIDLSPHMSLTWNIEGLAMTQDHSGRTLALMISDDGFSPLLPTVLIALGL